MQPDRRSLWRLLIAQTQVVFNDNASKLALISLAPLVLSAKEADWVTDLLAALLVLPFIIFSPLCGWLADHYPKQTVLKYALYLQTTLMFLMVFAFWLHLIYAAIVIFFLLALQACIFSPAKQGALKEMVGSSELTHAVGWMESLTIFGILSGGFVGAGLFTLLDQTFHHHWHGAAGCFIVLTLGCVLAIIVFGNAKTAGSQSHDPFSWSLFWNHFRDIAYLWHFRQLFLTAIGIAYFYSLGGLLYLIMVNVGRLLYPASSKAGFISGAYLAIMGAGIVAGALMVIRISRSRPTLGLAPIGALGMAAAFLFMTMLHPAGWLYLSVLVLLGIFSSLFIVPLNTFLQDNAAEDRRSRVIAATNLLLNLGGIIAVLFHALLENILHLHLPTQFFCVFLVTVVTCLLTWLALGKQIPLLWQRK